uniref:Leptin receptor gene-related protein n=1 Tax=Aceria tosichella TaxID=561515 RepID=A0A6G1SBP9_9ACAR
MASTTKIVGVGFLGSLGLTFIILGCVMSGKWWALLMFLFYGFTPIPLLFVRNDDGYQSLDGSEVNKSMDIAIFLVAGMIVSTIAFPILLTSVPVSNPGMDTTSAFLTEFATVIFYTTAGLFIVASEDEET